MEHRVALKAWRATCAPRPCPTAGAAAAAWLIVAMGRAGVDQHRRVVDILVAAGAIEKRRRPVAASPIPPLTMLPMRSWPAQCKAVLAGEAAAV